MAIIKNKIITIFGLPGTGKTLLTSFIACMYHMDNAKRIYSNVDFTYKGRKYSKRINSIDDIGNIKFGDKKGLVVLDEAGININSRRSMSSANLEYGKLGMLSRKKNIDIVIIGQLEYSIDKYLRDLSFCTLVMNSYFETSKRLKFEMDIKKGDYLIGTKEVDLFYMIENTNYGYNTLEESIIDKGKESKTINKKVKKENSKIKNIGPQNEQDFLKKVFTF